MFKYGMSAFKTISSAIRKTHSGTRTPVSITILMIRASSDSSPANFFLRIQYSSNDDLLSYPVDERNVGMVVITYISD
tara:strand:- start:586 stop:819 length:234 start_codon:yes stop_codon:yes gene_type:complete